MIAALALALQLQMPPVLLPLPDRQVTLAVGSHTTLLVRSKDLHGWGAWMSSNVFRVTLVQSDPHRKWTRLSLEAVGPGVAAIDFHCGKNGHEVWLVKVHD